MELTGARRPPESSFAKAETTGALAHSSLRKLGSGPRTPSESFTKLRAHGRRVLKSFRKLANEAPLRGSRTQP